MTLEQVRRIYQGQINNWQEFGAAALPVARYEPVDLDAIAVFQQRVLQQTNPTRSSRPAAKALPELDMMRSVIQDFETQRLGSIGFGSISKIVGQCSVYPLAIRADQQSVQPVVFDRQTPIAATTDLCDTKGNYHLDVEAFRTGRYPLAYPIAVVYARNNDRPRMGEKFAALLTTREGQRLLTQTGLVPLEPTSPVQK